MPADAPNQTTPAERVSEYTFFAETQRTAIRSSVVAKSESAARRRMAVELRERHRITVKPADLLLVKVSAI
jgi:hypothetical protein